MAQLPWVRPAAEESSPDDRASSPPSASELSAFYESPPIIWLKLGFAVAQSTVAKYMAKKGDPSGQSWADPDILIVLAIIGLVIAWTEGIRRWLAGKQAERLVVSRPAAMWYKSPSG
jgi:hypothetical protein